MITDEAMKAAVLLERMKNGEIKDFQKVLAQLDRAVKQIWAGYTDWPGDLTALKKKLRNAQVKIWDEYLDTLWENLENLSVHEQNVESGIITSQAEIVGATVGLARPRGVWGKTLTRPITGTGDLLEPFVKNLSSSQIQRIERQVMISWGMGRTMPETLRAIRGTKANNYKDGAWNGTLSDAKTVIRTSYQHVSSVAFLESDLSAGLEEYQLVATLDSRTSQLCRSLDLTHYPVGKGPVPPLHPNCRTRMVPYWGKDEDSTATRSSDTGYVPQDESFYQWLSRQPVSYQDETMGKTMGQLFRNGGVKPEEFSKRVVQNLRPLNLGELRTKYPDMFKTANV